MLFDKLMMQFTDDNWSVVAIYTLPRAGRWSCEVWDLLKPKLEPSFTWSSGAVAVGGEGQAYQRAVADEDGLK